MRLGIIADDLTGACDTALQFYTQGYRALVALHNTRPLPHAGAVIACDTDSRDAVPTTAFARVREVAQQLGEAGLGRVYKKLDSTLRGNVGTELDALLAASGAPAVVVAPSFPQTGRVVRGGRLYVHGVPLNETAFGAALPLRSATVAAVVAASARAQVAHIHQHEFATDDGLLHQGLTRLAGQGIRIICVDAASDNELRCIARVAYHSLGWPLAGSAGLAAALAREQPGNEQPRAVACTSKPLVVLVGSRSPVAVAQLAYLAQQQGVHTVLVAGTQLLGGARSAAIKQASEQLRAALCTRRVVVVASDPRVPGQTSDPTLARAVATGLAAIVAPVAPTLGGLIATGGDTAAAAFTHLGIHTLEVTGNVEAGVPILRAAHKHIALFVVTKAGGFGDDATLARACAALH